MKKIILLFALAVLSVAKAQTIRWQKKYGGSGSDFAYSTQQTSDGGYIVAGYTGSSVSGDVSGTNQGSFDVWVVKLDAAGAITWQKNYGGTANDSASYIQQTSDGGYIVVGSTGSSVSGDVSGINKGSMDVWVIKLDASGAITWQKNYGGSGVDQANYIKQTSDGGYIVAGSTTSSISGEVSGTNRGSADIWVLKLDASGGLTWQKNYGGLNNDYGQSIQQTSDGGYILGAYSNSSLTGDFSTLTSKGGNDYFFIKLDASGAVTWQKNYGSTGGDYLYAMQQTADGGFIAIGNIGAVGTTGDIAGPYKGGTYDIWVVKLDASGALSWEKNYGGTGSDQGYYIQQTADGGYILTGSTTTTANGNVSGFTNGGTDVWVAKLDASGTITWQKNYGGSGTDAAYSINQTSDGDYIVAGYTASSNGDASGTNNGLNDYWVFKVGTASLSTTTSSKISLHLFPNPTSSFFTINGLKKKSTAQVLDLSGKVVLSKEVNNGEQINVENINKGLYLVKIEDQIIKLLKQ